MVGGSRVNDLSGGRGNKHVLVLRDLTSVVIDVDVDLSDFDNEHTEIFYFYFAAYYNTGVHVLDYGNNDTTPPEGVLLVIEANLTRTSL